MENRIARYGVRVVRSTFSKGPLDLARATSRHEEITKMVKVVSSPVLPPKSRRRRS
jgi:hypothetical protein